MKNNNNAVAVEIEVLHQEIATLKEQIKHLVHVTNTNKEVLFDLLEEMKNADSSRLVD